jgi:flagellar assembly factor FliW
LLVLGICTVPDEFSDISINLLGPLVINTASRLGKQVVLNRSPYSTQHRLADASDEVGKPKPRRAAPRPRSGAPLAARAV